MEERTTDRIKEEIKFFEIIFTLLLTSFIAFTCWIYNKFLALDKLSLTIFFAIDAALCAAVVLATSYIMILLRKL